MRLTEFIRQVNKYDFLIERDVVNAGEIKKWVASISGRVQSDVSQKWFQSQLYQFLINRYDSRKDVVQIQQAPPGSPDWLVQKLAMGGELFNITPSTEVSEMAMSVIDYINAWGEENPGREPRMRWEQAATQADDWHKEMKNVSVSAEENEQDLAEIATIYEFPDGFKWVDLTTEACLKREGGRMGHCVGGYGAAVQAGTTKIFSLRNKKNLPHATMEATSEEPTVIASADDKQRDLFGDGANLPPLKIEQIKGRSNKPPVTKYVPYVKEFLEWGNFDVGRGLGDMQNMGLYRKQGKYYSRDEVSKIVKKYKDGTKWIKLDDDVEFDYYGVPYYLLDKNGDVIITANTMAEGDTKGYISGVTAPYGVKVDKEELRPKIIDLLNQSNNVGDTGDLRKTWDIYHDSNKHGSLKDVATVMYDLPNGNKAVSASNNNYVVNKKHEIVFEYEVGIDDGLSILKRSLDATKLDMNFGDLANALSEVSGMPLDTGYHSVSTASPVDNDNNPLEPSGEVVYEGDGISWYTGVVPKILSDNLDPDSVFIGYDRHKNPLYYIKTVPNNSPRMPLQQSYAELTVDGVGTVLGISQHIGRDRVFDYTQGEQILSIIIDQEWDTSDRSFQEEMFDGFAWLPDEYGVWWRGDGTAPASYVQIETNEDGEEEVYEDEDDTLSTFWENTGILDSGMDSEYIIKEYADFFNGNTIYWDSPHEERDVEDPETGEYTTAYYSMDYRAAFTGKEDDYKHPMSS